MNRKLVAYLIHNLIILTFPLRAFIRGILAVDEQGQSSHNKYIISLITDTTFLHDHSMQIGWSYVMIVLHNSQQSWMYDTIYCLSVLGEEPGSSRFDLGTMVE